MDEYWKKKDEAKEAEKPKEGDSTEADTTKTTTEQTETPAS